MKLSEDDGLSVYYSTQESDVVSLGEIYSDNFIAELNQLSDKMPALSDYSNELFLYFLYPMTEYGLLLQKYGANHAVADGGGLKKKLFLYKAMSIGVPVSVKSKVILHGGAALKILIAPFVIFLSALILSFMLLLRSSKQCRVMRSSIAVVRSAQVEKKLSFLKNDSTIQFYNDDAFHKDKSGFSLFEAIDIKTKASSFIKVPFLAIKDLFLVWRESAKVFGISLASHIVFYYLIRIPHKSLFEHCLRGILMQGHCKTLITGNKEDRFAVCEERLAKNYGMKVLCYPHGLEYGMKVPHGLPGDIFFCTSMEASIYLKSLYKNDKFIFDKSVSRQMFALPKSMGNTVNKMVFFTESREIDVNRKIISILKGCNAKFMVKLHPKDAAENYSEFALDYIESLEDAIVGNICLARKSTVLIESLYNDSTPVAVLIDGRDKAMFESLFPSLASTEIIRLRTDEELKNFADSNNCEN